MGGIAVRRSGLPMALAPNWWCLVRPSELRRRLIVGRCCLVGCSGGVAAGAAMAALRPRSSRIPTSLPLFRYLTRFHPPSTQVSCISRAMSWSASNKNGSFIWLSWER